MSGFLLTTVLVYILLFYANYFTPKFLQQHFMDMLENVLSNHEEDYPHDHLYDRDLTVINMTSFKFLINNDICNVRRVSLVTIIHSASQNTEARAIIRWGLRDLLIV